ncbi:asparagine synthase-related protein [Leptothoe sp. LEGE 181152]|nr:asparagine synthase-related protein [Leptothoe sp. LEGE 181152]
MSGIVGLFSRPSKPVSQALLRQITDSMVFRGPDAQTCWHTPLAGLGHALLRTAPEQEQQPLTLDQWVWISADVRLDGRDELIAKLRSYYADISSQCSDASLVLRAYHAWDTACVEHLQGDFAFLIWDEGQQRLFAARDHFGVVPFFYAQVKETLVCSNTLDCVRRYPGVSDRINEQAMADQVLWGMNLDYPTTLFDDVRRLPPAHTLTWEPGVLKVRPYWQLPRVQPLTLYKRPEDYVEHFSELFEQAVSDRLRSPQVATHLSGGIDSNSIAAVAQHILQQRGQAGRLQAFTMQDRIIMPKENAYAAMVAHTMGIPLNTLDATGRYRQVPDLHPARSPVLPPGSVMGRQTITTLMRRCGDHARTVLTGFGGDSALCFGEFYHWEWWQQGLRQRWWQVQLDYFKTHRTPRVFWWRACRRSIIRNRATVPPALDHNFAARWRLKQRFAVQQADALDKISRYGMGHTAVWSNLFEMHDPGMTGLPVKPLYPFFDLRLVEFLMAIPPIPWLVDKRLLREMMYGKLPEAIRTRKKMVFEAPKDYATVMQAMLPVWIEELVRTAPGLEAYVNREQLLKILRAADSAGTEAMEATERLLGLAYWLQVSTEAKPFSEQPLTVATAPQGEHCRYVHSCSL